MIPVDLDITPNGNLIVVRHGPVNDSPPPPANSITIWNAVDGLPRAIDFPGIPEYGNGAPLTPSDALAVTNDRAVLIGGTPLQVDAGGFFVPQDTTYIDVIDLAASPNPKVTVHHAITGTAFNRAGEPNDVAITRDGLHAIVNGKRYIHVLDLYSNPPGAIDREFDTGLDVGLAADSIATTNSRAIVAMRQLLPARASTWVYTIDLSVSPPAVLLSVDMTPSVTFGNSFYEPHDIAITPDGSMAVITAEGAVGIVRVDTWPFAGFKRPSLRT